MKAIFLFVIFCLIASEPVLSQVKTRTLKKVAELKMPKKADDDMPGTRGACVVWHPVQKKYYAVFAGNVDYPLAVFDMNGKRLSKEDLAANVDARGLWYNPVKKRIEGNEHADGGWFYYKLDAKGIVTESENFLNGLYQPADQCVGALNTVDKQVMFLDGSTISFFDTEGEEIDDDLILHLGRTKEEGADEDEDEYETPEDYNNTTIVYTGISKAEIGALNAESKQIELYDKKDGFMTQVLKLPDNATTETSFNFAFTNGIYWLFDMNKRVWTGYK